MNKIHIFECMGNNILCGISMVPFEIPHKVSCPYIERYDFYTTLLIYCQLDTQETSMKCEFKYENYENVF